MLKKLLILLIAAQLFGFLPILAQNGDEEEQKLILIHLDAASGYYVQEEMEKGNLPNLQKYFDEEHRIKYSITYFPSKTPTVISSIRRGMPLEEAILPGWKRADSDGEYTIGMLPTFLNMALSKSRLAVTNLLYGVPLFYNLAGPALVNTSDYLKDYNILEFYWYRVDSEGHFSGEASYRKELAIFDKHFGRLANRLDDDVNVIIYSDHGMTFGEGFEMESSIEEIIGDNLLIYSYPTIFLKEKNDLQLYAEKLVYETEFDFAFFQTDNEDIIGIHNEGVIQFNSIGETINYEYEGKDVLEYYENGYNGEYWDRESWLDFSYNLRYPLTPFSLYYFLQNPNSGDIVTLFEDNRYPKTGYSQSGNHGGLTWQEMVTPLFVKGPELDELYGREYFWLPNLFQEIEGINFNQNPPRERHFITSRYDFKRNRQVAQFSFSPAYRIQYGANMYFQDDYEIDRADIWGKFDIYRSYLVRLWLGGGVEVNGPDYSPFLIFEHHIHIRKFILKNSFATNRQFYFTASWEVLPWLAIETVNFNSLGLRIDF